jgi:transposase-like protein
MSERYYYDTQIFTKDLYERCRKFLGNKYAVISFRDPRDPMTSTEQKLGRELVEECRLALKLKGISKRRNVYFGGDGKRRVRKNEKRNIGIQLIEAGHSAQAVADALGVTRSTVARWIPSKRKRGAPGHSDVEHNEVVFRNGIQRMCENEGLAFSAENVDSIVDTLSSALWVRPDKLRRRALCAGWALVDLVEDSGLAG